MRNVTKVSPRAAECACELVERGAIERRDLTERFGEVLCAVAEGNVPDSPTMIDAAHGESLSRIVADPAKHTALAERYRAACPYEPGADPRRAARSAAMSSPRTGGAQVGAPAAAIERIAEANQAAGYHFFDPDTIRFFSSIIYPRVYAGRYFITGERCDEHYPERFTIRVALDNGQVETVGDFQAFETHEAAEDAVIDGVNRGELSGRR